MADHPKRPTDSPESPVDSGLPATLRKAVEQYRVTRWNHAGLAARDLQEPEREWMLSWFQAAESVAGYFLDAAYRLASPAAADVLETLKSAAAFSGDRERMATLMGPVAEAVQERLALKACDVLEDASTRFWKLISLIQARKDDPRSTGFLHRVSRCYLFGFDVECVILCRGVLDVEFQEAVSDEDYRRANQGPKNQPIALSSRIWAAQRLGWISYATKEAAQRLKDHANSLVHAKPTANVDAYAAIRITLDAIAELNRGMRRRPPGRS